MNTYRKHHKLPSSNVGNLSAQIMNLPYKDLNESLSQKPEGLTISTYNMFKVIGSACNACICKICEYLKGQTMPTSALRCDCKPCNCKDCTGPVNYFETANIELRLRYKNKFRNELSHVKTKAKGRQYGNINFCQYRNRSCSNMPSQREECKQKTFRRSTLTVAPVEESAPLENSRCSPCSCDQCTNRGLNVSGNQTHEISTSNISANCQCENCLDNSCRSNSIDTCKCSVRRGVFKKPTEKYIQDYDIHSATVENRPLVIKGKRLDGYDPVTIFNTLPCISGICQCTNKNAVNSHMRLHNTLKSKDLKFTDSGLCKCTQCECLACSFPKQPLYTESLESLRTCIMCNHSGNKWKGRSKFDERGHTIRASKKGNIRVVENSSKAIIIEESNPEKRFHCGLKTCRDSPMRPCRCTKQNDLFHKTNVKEMLDNVYSNLKVEDHEKHSEKNSTVDLSSGQLIHSNYEVCTLVNSETNTENNIANKCIETDSCTTDKKTYASNKVKNYEYTLRIEIQTPNFNETKEATKERIKKDTKKGIKEQTRRVVRELFSDISKTSLFNENSQENVKAFANEQKLKNMDLSEENKVRSILKQNILPSTTGEAPSSTIQSLSTTELPSSTKSKGTILEDCFFVRCLPPLQNTVSQMTEKVNEESKTKISSKYDDTLSLTSIMQNCSMSVGNMKNEWRQIFPAVPELTTLTPSNTMEKITSTANVEAFRDLHELKVQEPCVRRVSDHTVSLKWKLPKAMEDVLGYEILVDGKTIEKIMNPTRCLAVVSCLPPVGRILITIRTITKSPGLPGLFPCTTIGYRPKANKTIYI